MRSTLVALAAAMAAVGASLGASQSLAQPAPHPTDEASWNRGVRDSCIPSAERSGAPPPVAGRFCDCVVRVLDELTPQARAALTASSPLLPEAAAICRPLVSPPAAGAPPVSEDQSRAWDRNTYNSCVPAAEGKHAAPEVAQRYCTCVVRVLDELPPAAKIALTPQSPELGDAADICRPASMQ